MALFEIEARLKKMFKADRVLLEDESPMHAGHMSAKKGSPGGHYKILIVSAEFQDLPLIERHRRVYSAFNELGIDAHALSIQAVTPQECAARQS